ncbi:Uncharacterised protein [Vibrio cholerae]|nr:Uncharacterised protein [Vibrio cholerae]CSC47494.1 Uncharacterised protein [Vibrio cholerae]CSI35020.1 Uncharacterised protein [Vibrio cholerae]CSI63950.1 Uncharacterised protein [Vibrio cholerae]
MAKGNHKGHQWGDGVNETLKKRHHRTNDTLEQGLLRSPLRIALLNRLVNHHGCGESLVIHIFARHALLINRQKHRRGHVLLGVNRSQTKVIQCISDHVISVRC